MKSIMLSLFICLTINLLYGQISLDQPLPPPPPPPSPPSEQVEIDVYRSLHISDLPDNKYWIVGEAGKLGIYNLVSNKWQVTPQFDTLGLYDMKLFGRNSGEEVLTLIDIETGKTSETNFIKLEFRYVTDSNSPYTVNRCKLTTREGEYCYFAKDEVYYLSKDQYKASRDGLNVLSPSKSSRVPKNSGGNLSEAVVWRFILVMVFSFL